MIRQRRRYAARLLALRDELQRRAKLSCVCLFEKPRTTVGWKGLTIRIWITASRLTTVCVFLRKLLLDINDSGLPAAGEEFLDMITPQYHGRLMSWGAIGARTTGVPRFIANWRLASACPVGLKNGTDGTIKVAIDAIPTPPARRVLPLRH